MKNNDFLTKSIKLSLFKTFKNIKGFKVFQDQYGAYKLIMHLDVEGYDIYGYNGYGTWPESIDYAHLVKYISYFQENVRSIIHTGHALEKDDELFSDFLYGKWLFEYDDSTFSAQVDLNRIWNDININASNDLEILNSLSSPDIFKDIESNYQKLSSEVLSTYKEIL